MFRDDAEIADGAQRRAAPKRGQGTRKNLQKKVEVRAAPKRGPKPTSNKRQVGMRLEPEVLKALFDLEDQLRDTHPERSDVIRLLLETYAESNGQEPPPPDIPRADALAGRTEVLSVPMTAAVREFFEGSATEHGWTPGETFERIAAKAVQFDQSRGER